MKRIKDDRELKQTISKYDYSNIFNINTDLSIVDELVLNESFSINKAVTFKNVPGPTDKNPNYFIYEVQGTDTYYNIAFKTYGTEKLWWLVCKLNQIHDPSVLPTSGTLLTLLNPTLIESLINSLNK